MAEVQAVLLYSPGGMGPDGTVTTIGRTSAPEALRALRDQILAELEAQVAYWRVVEPALGELKAVEAERTARLMALVFDDEHPRSTLRLVPDSPKG
jgi:hypothetical protein